jgi:hypothetical protein
MKNSIKPILILLSVMLAMSCSENSPQKTVISLQPEEKQAVLAMSDQFNTLLRQKTTLDFIKTGMQQKDKASFMLDYLSPTLKGDELDLAAKIIGKLFQNQPNHAVRAEGEEVNSFTLSPTVAKLTEKLTVDLKNVETSSDHGDKSTGELASDLKTVITGFKKEVHENTSLTFDEARALMAFAEFENNTISETVNLATALHLNNGGRTQCFFSNLLSVVIAVMVAAVVVVSAAATGGLMAVIAGATINAPTWGTIIGVSAAVGGLYGGIVGYDLAYNQHATIIDFN